MKEYIKNDYRILVHIDKNGFDNPYKSVKTRVISNELKLSYVKVKNTLLNFLKDGYVLEGIIDNRSKTYYITAKGKEELQKMLRG